MHKKKKKRITQKTKKKKKKEDNLEAKNCYLKTIFAPPHLLVKSYCKLIHKIQFSC